MASIAFSVALEALREPESERDQLVLGRSDSPRTLSPVSEASEASTRLDAEVAGLLDDLTELESPNSVAGVPQTLSPLGSPPAPLAPTAAAPAAAPERQIVVQGRFMPVSVGFGSTDAGIEGIFSREADPIFDLTGSYVDPTGPKYFLDSESRLFFIERVTAVLATTDAGLGVETLTLIVPMEATGALHMPGLLVELVSEHHVTETVQALCDLFRVCLRRGVRLTSFVFQLNGETKCFPITPFAIVALEEQLSIAELFVRFHITARDLQHPQILGLNFLFTALARSTRITQLPATHYRAAMRRDLDRAQRVRMEHIVYYLAGSGGDLMTPPASLQAIFGYRRATQEWMAILRLAKLC